MEDEQREVQAGGIVVIAANKPHRFINSGNTLLRHIGCAARLDKVEDAEASISRVTADQLEAVRSAASSRGLS